MPVPIVSVYLTECGRVKDPNQSFVLAWFSGVKAGEAMFSGDLDAGHFELELGVGHLDIVGECCGGVVGQEGNGGNG